MPLWVAILGWLLIAAAVWAVALALAAIAAAVVLAVVLLALGAAAVGWVRRRRTAKHGELP